MGKLHSAIGGAINQCDPVSDLRGPLFSFSRTSPCTKACTYFEEICTISCTFWAISCTIFCTMYFVYVHFSLQRMFDFCTCTFLEGLFCTCTKSHVQKIPTNVQNHVQNSALVRTFFHDICTSRVIIIGYP